MAITRARKQEFLQQYKEYLEKAQGLVLVSFQGLSVPETQALRNKLRENGSTYMVVKNTLLRIALQETDYPLPETQVLEGPTAVVFALEDPVAAAKAVVDFMKEHEGRLAVKAGYLERRVITAEEVVALAKLPPLPVLRAQLIGLLTAPASRLVRVLAEPGRQLAALLKAYSEKQAEASPAS